MDALVSSYTNLGKKKYLKTTQLLGRNKMTQLLSIILFKHHFVSKMKDNQSGLILSFQSNRVFDKK